MQTGRSSCNVNGEELSLILKPSPSVNEPGCEEAINLAGCNVDEEDDSFNSAETGIRSLASRKAPGSRSPRFKPSPFCEASHAVVAPKFRVTYAGPPPSSPIRMNGGSAFGKGRASNGWPSAAPDDATINSFADFVVREGKSSSKSAGETSSVWKFMPFLVNQKRKRRLMGKSGDCNISHKRVEHARRRFLADIYTSLVDLKWRYVLLICNTSFVVSWVFFALIWWIIGYAHGDFHEDAAQRPERPCVMEVRGFPTALLYSIETQHTIGYGGRQLTDECPEAILLLMIQSLFGMIMQALITGAMFAKLALPKKRAETLMFSKNAVICERDGSLCLMFRIGDMRRSHLIGASIRAVLVTRRSSQDGDLIDQTSIRLGMEKGPNRLMIMWPTIILHKIDEKSPFWDMSKEGFEQSSFELIVILEGVIEATGMTTQARTSYLPSEIFWGHRMERLMTFQKEDGRYNVDYSRFHVTVPIPTPTCSARERFEKDRGQLGMAQVASYPDGDSILDVSCDEEDD